MELFKEKFIKEGGVTLYEYMCECGEYFALYKAKQPSCPHCTSGDTCINGKVSFGHEGLNQECYNEKRAEIIERNTPSHEE